MTNVESPPARTRHGLILAAIVLLALGLRLLYVQGMRASPGFDQPGMDALYHVEWARAMVAGEDFLRDRHHPVGEPSAYFRAPGYIAFLAMLLKLGGGGLLVPRLVQCLLGALTTWLTYQLGARVFDPVRGLVAAFLAATYWLFLYYDAELMIPTLFVPLNLAGLVLAHDALEARGRGRLVRSALTGLVFGLAAITRPTVLTFMPCLALWMLWRARREGGSWRAGLVPTLLLTLGTLIPIAPITAHNLAAGDFALIATQGGVNFWIGNNPDSDGSTAIVPGTRGSWWGGYQDSIAQAEAAQGRSLSPSEVSRHYSQRAWAFIRAEPGAWLALLARKLALFWSAHEFGNNQPIAFYAYHFNPWTRFLPLRYPELLALGLLGLGLTLDLRRGVRSLRVVPPALFLLVYSAGVVAFFVCARFRMPVLPILMVFAAHALVWFWERAREKRWDLVGLALVPVLISATLSRTTISGMPENDSQGWWHLGVAEGIRGAGDAAEAALRRALELDPRNTYARVALGKRLEAKGERGEAIEHLREALRTDGRRVDALDPLLRMLVETGQLAEAEAVAEQGRRLYPELAVPQHWLGRVRQAQERPQEALQLYQAAAERDPGAYTLFIDLGRLALELGQGNLATQAFERARANLANARGGEAEEVYRWLIQVLAARDRARALELAREYARLFPDSPRARGMLRELEG